MTPSHALSPGAGHAPAPGRSARFHQTRDADEREELCRRYLPLARSLALRYRHTSESLDDLFQVASIGLLKAIDRYDPTRRAAFSSFAVPTILGELRRHLRDHTWSVRVSRDLQELSLRAGRATDELAARLGRPPTVAEIAAALDVSPELMLDARQALTAHSPRSLDEPAGDDEEQTPRGNLLGREDPELAAVEDAVLLEGYLARLPARTREVLRLRFEADLKQDEIGAALGISQAHVSRLIRESIEELHAVATAE